MANYRTQPDANQVREWCLVRHADPAQAVLSYLSACGGAVRFGVRVALPEGLNDELAPIDAVFHFRAERAPGNRRGISYTWEHREGFALPSLRGELVVRRFGPFAALCITGSYDESADPAGRLFNEALGARLAQRTLAEALAAFRFILKQRISADSFAPAARGRAV